MMVGMVVGVILAMAMYATVLIGGIQMARLRQWGLALTASIFSILPMILGIVTLNPCSIAMTVPGVALGIWGIVMLCNASVKRQFR